jgi:hypothetical protein
MVPLGVMLEQIAQKAARQAVLDARTELSLTGVGKLVGEAVPLAFETAAGLFDREFPPTPWLVRGLITQESVYAVAGEPKTAKTWAALEIAMAIGTGTRAFGEYQTGEPQPVLCYLVEDGPKATRNRLRALAASRGLDPVEACRNIWLRNLNALRLTDSTDLSRFVAGVKALPQRPACIVLDPLRDLHDQEENDSDGMARVMHALRALRATLKCAVIFVHHAGKASEATKGRRPGQRMRGSSAIHGAVDGGLYLYDLKQEDENLWKNSAYGEVKAAKSAGEFTLALAVEDDEHGEAITARWEVSKGGVKGEELRSTVLAALRGQTDKWIGCEPLARTLKAKTNAVRSALYDLQGDGLAERSVTKSGPASGWRATPEGRKRTDSESRPIPSRTGSSIPSRPLGRDGMDGIEPPPFEWDGILDDCDD